MEHRYRICRLAVAAAAIALLYIAPCFAQTMPVPCSAFFRGADGRWKVLAPVVFSVEGRLFAPTVGTSISARSVTNGVYMGDLLDRQCRSA